MTRWLEAAPWRTITARRRAGAISDDLLAGLTVTLVGIPQCLAYAMMSGLPPAYGLVTAAVPGLVAALAGRSAHVVTGPTNTTGLLILAALAPYLGANGLIGREGLPVLATLTLFAGLVRVVGTLAGGAMMVRFLPQSVLVGFSAGAGVLIAAMQLDEALGLPPVAAASLVEELRGVTQALGARGPGLWALGLTIGTSAVLIIGRRFAPRWPVALLVVVAGVMLAWASGLDASRGLPLVLDRSGVPSGWPMIALPALSPAVVSDLALPALAIVFLGTLELTVTAHAGEARPDLRREIMAQGWANVAGAFAGAFPASASLTRSALLRLGRAHTRLAAATAAVLTVPVLLWAGPAIGVMPQASLAAVLFVTAYGMVDRAQILRMWRAGPETRLLVGFTFVATLVLPLTWAILLGGGIGLFMFLVHTSTPRLRLLVPDGDTLRPPVAGSAPDVVVIEVSGDLHYAAVPAFAAEAEAILPPSAKLVVLDLSHAHQARFAALKAFEALGRTLEARGGHVCLAGVEPRLARFLHRAGCTLSMTPASDHPGSSAQACLTELRRRPRE